MTRAGYTPSPVTSVTGYTVTDCNAVVTNPSVTEKVAEIRRSSRISGLVTYPNTTFVKYRGKRDGKPGYPPISVYADMRCRKFEGDVCNRRPRSIMTNLARIATALNRPVLSFTWRDGMARVVLADGRIAAGLGDTKADAWARLVSVLGEG